MPDSIELNQNMKSQPPAIRLAVEVLSRVEKDAAELAKDWRKKLPALAMRLASAGQEINPDGLERIVRENWDAAKIEALFHSTATEITRPAKLTYEAVVSALPKTEAGLASPEATEAELLDKLQKSIAAGADIHADDDAMLLMAAGIGYLDIVKYLLEKDGEKADIHAENDRALREAAKYGCLDVVKYLLERDGEKANIHASNDYALRWAAGNGLLEVVKYLLEKDGEKADMHANNDKALHDAATFGQLEVIKYLLEKDGEKADIHANNDKALSRAAWNGQLEIVKYLLERDGEKADIHADNDYALREAVEWKHFEIAHYLLEQGANRKALKPYQAREINKVPAAIARWRKVAHQSPPTGLWKRDPEGINLLALSVCADMLRQEGYKTLIANSYAYEAMRLFGDEQQVLRYLERWGHAGKQPLHDVVLMIDCPQRQEPTDPAPFWDRKIWADAVMAQGPKMAKIVKFAARLTEDGKPFAPVRAKDGVVSLHLTIKRAAQFAYKNSAAHPEFAALCFAHLLNESAFEAGLKIINKTPKDLVKNLPDIEIAGEEFGMSGARWRRLAAHDIKGLLLGQYTDCCQSIGGVGAACAKHGYKSPDSGFYVLEKANGGIVGQAWAWRSAQGDLVLDSLETLGDHVSASTWKKLVAAFAAKLAENPGDITSLRIGTGGGTPKNMGLDTAAEPATPKAYSGYRDSGKQFHVASFAPTIALKPAQKNTRKDAAAPSAD